MLTPLEALLAAVIDQPDDDAPRLIVADWLEEFGTTPAEAMRAEYIRLEIAVAAERGADPRTARAVRAEQRASLLLRSHAGAVLGLPAVIARDVGGRLLARRGFVEAMSATPHGYWQLAEALFGLAPVREVWVYGLLHQGDMHAIEDVDPGRGVRVLNLEVDPAADPDLPWVGWADWLAAGMPGVEVVLRRAGRDIGLGAAAWAGERSRRTSEG